MQSKEFRGENFGDGDQIDLHRASDGLLSLEEVQARREFDAATREALRLVRVGRIQNDNPERPIPLPVPTEPRELVITNSEGMVHMREQYKQSQLTGEMKTNVSWMDAPSTQQQERRAA